MVASWLLHVAMVLLGASYVVDMWLLLCCYDVARWFLGSCYGVARCCSMASKVFIVVC